MRPALCGVKRRAGRGKQTRAETTKHGGWKGLRRGGGTGLVGLAVAPLPAALFLAHRRRAPEGRAGNHDSFPAAPSPPSPRLLLGRPEANPPLDGRDPVGPPTRSPATTPSPAAPDSGSARGSSIAKVRREPPPRQATAPRASRKLGARVAPTCQEPPPRPLASPPRGESIGGYAGERTSGGGEGYPVIPGAGKR